MLTHVDFKHLVKSPFPLPENLERSERIK